MQGGDPCFAKTGMMVLSSLLLRGKSAPRSSDCYAYIACGLLGGICYSLLLWVLNQCTQCFYADLVLHMVTDAPHARILVFGGLFILTALAGASYQYSPLSSAGSLLLAVGAAVCLSLMLYDPLHFVFSVGAALGISLFHESWASMGPVNGATKFVFFFASAVIWGGNVWLATHLCSAYILATFSGLILCSLISPAIVAIWSQGRVGRVAHKGCSSVQLDQAAQALLLQVTIV